MPGRFSARCTCFDAFTCRRDFSAPSVFLLPGSGRGRGPAQLPGFEAEKPRYKVLGLVPGLELDPERNYLTGLTRGPPVASLTGRASRATSALGGGGVHVSPWRVVFVTFWRVLPISVLPEAVPVRIPAHASSMLLNHT